MNFKGRAKRLDDIDLPKLGALIGVGEDELHAVLDVETRGTGFDDQGRPRILFERHKFYKYVPAEKRTQAVNAGLASKTSGGYGKESDQYPKLERAMKIDKQAALLSCSWGLPQIMGFNYISAGYSTVEDMIEAFMDDEENQLAAMVRFIKNNKLDDNLRAHDWDGFALGYNGQDYKKHEYQKRLADAFAKWSRIKDTSYDPRAMPAPPKDFVPGPDPIQTRPEVPRDHVTVSVTPERSRAPLAVGVVVVVVVAALAWYYFIGS